MDDVSPLDAYKTSSASPPEPALAAKAVATGAVGSGEDAGQSTACCSSEDEFQNSGLCLSEDDREDSGAHVHRSPALQLGQYAAAGAEEQSHLTRQLEPHNAAYTYTVSGLENITFDQPPTSWLKPRIKIDGPEVFHGTCKPLDEFVRLNFTAGFTSSQSTARTILGKTVSERYIASVARRSNQP